MPTFTYAPGVKVYIDTEKDGVLDVSDDLVEGIMERRSDGVSTFQFSLQNRQRKYDQKFAPNDRIIVMMKRVTWLRVFTGYLNSVPLLTAWPSNVSIAATCSLKRLQYWYWDAYAPYTQNLIRLAAGLGNKTNEKQGDGGATNIVLTILNDVVGWPNSKVHIGKIPPVWLDFAADIAKSVQIAIDASTIDLNPLFGDGTGTTGSGAAGAVGTYGFVNGGYAINNKQMAGVNAIYNVGSGQGRSINEMAFAVYCAMAETNINPKYAEPGSTGNGGYGMFSQLQSQPGLENKINKQVTEFFIRFDRLKGNLSLTDTKNWLVLSRKVQRYGIVGQYDDPSNANLPNSRYVSAAIDVINKIKDGTVSTSTSNGDGTAGGVSGAAIVNQASVLLNQNIPYTHWRGNISKASIATLKQKGIDCSGLVYWVFEQVLGHGKTPFVATVENAGSKSIYQYCQKNGRVVAAPASADDPLYKIPGALLFVINRGGGSDDHVGIALGDGTKNAIQARRPGKPASVTTDNWDHIGFPDKLVDYSAQGGASGTGSSAVAPSTPASEPSIPPIQLPRGPIDDIFGTQYYTPAAAPGAIQEASSLVGIRALMNDQPILPWIKGLMNSTMRSYCSAPNGDFIAWFPDYYGIWGTAAIMTIQPIELQDFQVYWSDDFFVTHQFTVAGSFNFFNTGTGSVETQFPALNNTADYRVQTRGIATIEIPEIMKSLFGIDIDNGEFTDYVYKRFGARQSFERAEGLIGYKAEFFSALYFFMRQWVNQYNAEVPLTFMPELFPGMLIQIPLLDFQAYVTTVTHSFQFGKGGGFSTAVNISSPARIPNSKDDKSHSLIGLPDFGGVRVPKNPGRDSGGLITDFEDSRIEDIPSAGIFVD